MHDDITIGWAQNQPACGITEPPFPFGFADLQVYFFCLEPALLQGAMKFQEQLNYEISNILISNYLVSIVGLMDPKSLHLWVDGPNKDSKSVPWELIDRWPPSIAYHNSLLGSGFATNQVTPLGVFL